MPKMSIKERTKKVFGYMAVRRVGPSFMSRTTGVVQRKKFCEAGVANCLLKSWRKTSAYEIRTFRMVSMQLKQLRKESLKKIQA